MEEQTDMAYEKIRFTQGAQPVTKSDGGGLIVPDRPIILYIEGDGVGPDITRAAMRVWNAAVKKAYRGRREAQWTEIFAGEKALSVYGPDQWLPEETARAAQEFLVAIKGPLTTPIGGGIRSLNVALRQKLDLYVCLRPVRWFKGVPSPLLRPENTDMVVFRENTEDIYAGIEWAAGTPEAEKIIAFLQGPMAVKNIRFPETSGIGIKPVSRQGTERLVRAALKYAIENRRPKVTLVHKGNIMKFTEGAFKQWGYDLVRKEFAGAAVVEADCPGGVPKGAVTVNDVLADSFFQQLLLRPREYSVIATMNLNGDYISDALAACVGGIGIAPGANINYETGTAIFEATHGTAPRYAGLDKVNPGSLILSGEMLFRHIGWAEAADLILLGVDRAIEAKTVTYDFARLMDNAREVKCGEFGEAVAAHIESA